MFYDIKNLTRFQSFHEKTAIIFRRSLQRSNAVFGEPWSNCSRDQQVF